MTTSRLTQPCEHDVADPDRAELDTLQNNLRLALDRLTAAEARIDDLQGQRDTSAVDHTVVPGVVVADGFGPDQALTAAFGPFSGMDSGPFSGMDSGGDHDLDHIAELGVLDDDNPGNDANQTDPSVNRPRFLTRAALAASGAAVGAVAASVATAVPAAAADGDALLAGGINTATTRTVIQTSGDLEYGFGVHEAGLTAFPVQGAISGQAGTVYDAGVLGYATNGGTGVRGESGSGVGVIGSSSDSYGVGAISNAGAPTVSAFQARATAGAKAATLVGPRPLHFRNESVRLPPTQDVIAAEHGQLTADRDGADTSSALWFCTNAGTPGTWRKLAGPDTAGSFHILPSTIRVYDSRPGDPPITVQKGTIGGAETRAIDCKLGAGVPAGATAVVVNLTIVDTSASGFIALHKSGLAWPGNSTINWGAANTVLANSAVVATDTQARIAATCSTGSFTHIIIDVVGYYR